MAVHVHAKYMQRRFHADMAPCAGQTALLRALQRGLGPAADILSRRQSLAPALPVSRQSSMLPVSSLPVETAA